MTDYSKLVKALRCCIPNPPETCVGCPYNIGNNECNVKMMVVDAADAIEALQAEVERLKDSNEELREKQTFIDHYGTEWMTSAKDVPTSSDPRRPGPLVNAMASISSIVTPAFFNAWSTTGRIFC